MVELYCCQEQTEKQGKSNRLFHRQCDSISGNAGKVEVLYSMMETRSNENVKMSSPKCYRANNTMFPTSNPVEKQDQSLLTSGGWSLYEIAKVPESFQHKVCTLDHIG